MQEHAVSQVRNKSELHNFILLISSSCTVHGLQFISINTNMGHAGHCGDSCIPTLVEEAGSFG